MNISEIVSDAQEKLRGGAGLDVNWKSCLRIAARRMTNNVKCENYRIHATLNTAAESAGKPTLPDGVFCYTLPILANGMTFDDPLVIADEYGSTLLTYVSWPDMRDNWKSGTFTVASFNGTQFVVAAGLDIGTTCTLHGYTRKLFKSGVSYSNSVVDEVNDTVNLTDDEASVIMYEALREAEANSHQEGDSDKKFSFMAELEAAYDMLPASNAPETINTINDRPI